MSDRSVLLFFLGEAERMTVHAPPNVVVTFVDRFAWVTDAEAKSIVEAGQAITADRAAWIFRAKLQNARYLLSALDHEEQVQLARKESGAKPKAGASEALAIEALREIHEAERHFPAAIYLLADKGSDETAQKLRRLLKQVRFEATEAVTRLIRPNRKTAEEKLRFMTLANIFLYATEVANLTKNQAYKQVADKTGRTAAAVEKALKDYAKPFRTICDEEDKATPLRLKLAGFESVQEIADLDDVQFSSRAPSLSDQAETLIGAARKP